MPVQQPSAITTQLLIKHQMPTQSLDMQTFNNLFAFTRHKTHARYSVWETFILTHLEQDDTRPTRRNDAFYVLDQQRKYLPTVHRTHPYHCCVANRRDTIV